MTCKLCNGKGYVWTVISLDSNGDPDIDKDTCPDCEVEQ